MKTWSVIFGLEVAEDKTRIIPIGRFKVTKEDFDFWGFTFSTRRQGEGNIPPVSQTQQEEAEA